MERLIRFGVWAGHDWPESELRLLEHRIRQADCVPVDDPGQAHLIIVYKFTTLQEMETMLPPAVPCLYLAPYDMGHQRWVHGIEFEQVPALLKLLKIFGTHVLRELEPHY